MHLGVADEDVRHMRVAEEAEIGLLVLEAALCLETGKDVTPAVGLIERGVDSGK